ncbi:MAG: septation protein A [Betaproteobacteria bacterium]|nr:septation protein A [Betaproteobacteria bacterium]
MKFLFELLPILVFFGAYQVWGIEVATLAAIVASVAQILWLKWRKLAVTTMQWFALGLIVVFGGLTLVLHDPWFIKMKPSVLNTGFALALLTAWYGWKRNLIRALMGSQVHLEASGWHKLMLAWAAFFLGMAALNVWVATAFSEEVWVNFKLFGFLGLFLVFAVAQGVWVSRHGEMIEEGAPGATGEGHPADAWERGTRSAEESQTAAPALTPAVERLEGGDVRRG